MLIRREKEMNILQDLKDKKIIKIITGVRRAGKSTLLDMFSKEVKDNLKNEKQIQSYNFDDINMQNIGDYKAIFKLIESNILEKEMNYIFLDEIQNIDSFEKIVESLFLKSNVDIYITGSNAKMLSNELATLLTGRYFNIEILPFSYKEYLEAFPDSSKYQNSTTLINYLYNGSLPQTVSLGFEQPDIRDKFTDDILFSIIEKDIFSRHQIYDKRQFNQVIDFICDSIGSLVSPNSIARSLSNNGFRTDNKTISSYLNYLTECLLLYKVPRFEIKGKKLLKTLDKYYLVDTGFRKSRLKKGINDDLGHLLENSVYLELRRRNKNVWIGDLRGGEVDFVVEDLNGYTSYYQVSYSTNNRETLDRELKPLKQIKDSFPKFLLTTDIDIDPVYDGIRKYNVEKWLRGEYEKL